MSRVVGGSTRKNVDIFSLSIFNLLYNAWSVFRGHPTVSQSGRSVEIFAQWSYDLFARISPLSLVPGGLDEHAGKPEIFVVKSGIGHRSEI